MAGRLYKLDSEDAIQTNFFCWLAVNTKKFPELDLFFSIPNGGYRAMTTAKLLKRTGQKSGVPDTFLPVARNGSHGLWIEFKSAKGTASINQMAWITVLRAQNYQVNICRTWAEAAQVVIDYLGLDIQI